MTLLPKLTGVARALIASALAFGVAPVQAAAPSAQDLAFFESKVRPLLARRCYECHSRESGKCKGGDSGQVIVQGDPERSLLIKALRSADKDLEMPPTEKLPKPKIVILTQSVKMVAPDPRATEPVVKAYRQTTVAPSLVQLSLAQPLQRISIPFQPQTPLSLPLQRPSPTQTQP